MQKLTNNNTGPLDKGFQWLYLYLSKRPCNLTVYRFDNQQGVDNICLLNEIMDSLEINKNIDTNKPQN